MTAVKKLLLAILLRFNIFCTLWINIDSISIDEDVDIVCPEFKHIVVDNITLLNFSIPTEADVARLGHVNGVKPIHYNVTMNFLNEGYKNFTSEVTVQIITKQTVDRLVVDFHLDALTFLNISNVYVINDKNNEVVCFESVTFVKQDRKIIAELSKQLEIGKYVVHLGSVKGSPSDGNSNKGSAGLALGGIPGDGKRNRMSTWALTTIFQMRYARTVFPCFDHPSLKATFRICVEHSNDTTAAGNTPLEKKHVLKNNRLLECFEKTVKIPTYLFTVGLMYNFTKITDTTDKPQFDLYYSKPRGTGNYSWELPEARKIVHYLQNVTNFAFPSPKLGFLNAPGAPFWGVENFGLITLDSGWTQFPEYERAHTNLVHEIVHQWLGDVATISDWSEICLQESLTAIFELTIAYKLNLTTRSVSSTINELKSEAWYKSFAEPIVRTYNKTHEIADYCFGMPPIVLNMISETYDDIWNKFLNLYVKKYRFANANVNDWVETLNQAAGDKNAGAILESWFTQPGYPVFYSYLNGKNSVTIIQYMSKNDYNDKEKDEIILYSPKKAKVTPLSVISKNSPSTNDNRFVVNSVNQTYQLKNISANDWFIIDKSDVTLSRKLYSVENYLTLVNCYATSPNSCDGRTMNTVIRDFCYAFVNNWLPLERDADKFYPKLWTELFDKLSKILTYNPEARDPKKIHVDHSECYWCMSTNDAIENNKISSTQFEFRQPAFIWNVTCKHLNLIKMMNRNFTLNMQINDS